MNTTENSVDKYSSGVPFDASKLACPCLPEEKMQQLQEAFAPVCQIIIDAVLPVLQQIVDALVPVLSEMANALSEVLPDVWESIWTSYPDRRVVHLAKHSKKERVRKKNYNRIMKWFVAEGAVNRG